MCEIHAQCTGDEKLSTTALGGDEDCY